MLRRVLDPLRVALETPLAALWLASALPRLRRDARRRRAALIKPRVVLGPTPIISLRDWAQVLRACGYATRTVVTHVYPINARSDFDDVHADSLGLVARLPILGSTALLLRAVRSGEVLVTFYDGRFLSHTPLERFEGRFWRAAGRAVVVIPYGSDVAVAGTLGPYEEAMAADYPQLLPRADEIRARVDDFAATATLAIRNHQPGYVPRGDVVWPTQWAVDLERWATSPPPSDGDGRSGPLVRVLHAPNHRRLKGTGHLEAAIARLRAEGLAVELDLVERVAHTEIPARIATADVVVEGVVAGYGLFALEAMAAGRPLVTNMGWMAPELRAEPALASMPVVDASAETVTDRLRELVLDPALRARLGSEGRAWVERHASPDAIGERWSQAVDRAWAAVA